MRLCKDCKHFGYVETEGYKCSFIEEVCLLTRDEKYHTTTGEDISEYLQATHSRSSDGKCGNEGRLFVSAAADDKKKRSAVLRLMILKKPPVVGALFGLCVVVAAVLLWAWPA
jgi:hypothetical protein